MHRPWQLASGRPHDTHIERHVSSSGGDGGGSSSSGGGGGGGGRSSLVLTGKINKLYIKLIFKTNNQKQI